MFALFERIVIKLFSYCTRVLSVGFRMNHFYRASSWMSDEHRQLTAVVDRDLVSASPAATVIGVHSVDDGQQICIQYQCAGKSHQKYNENEQRPGCYVDQRHTASTPITQHYFIQTSH